MSEPTFSESDIDLSEFGDDQGEYHYKGPNQRKNKVHGRKLARKALDTEQSAEFTFETYPHTALCQKRLEQYKQLRKEKAKDRQILDDEFAGAVFNDIASNHLHHSAEQAGLQVLDEEEVIDFLLRMYGQGEVTDYPFEGKALRIKKGNTPKGVSVPDALLLNFQNFPTTAVEFTLNPNLPYITRKYNGHRALERELGAYYQTAYDLNSHLITTTSINTNLLDLPNHYPNLSIEMLPFSNMQFRKFIDKLR